MTDQIGEHPDAPIRIEKNQIIMLEEACDITRVRPNGRNSWNVSLSCWGEGMKWHLRETWTFDSRTLRIRGQTYSPCNQIKTTLVRVEPMKSLEEYSGLWAHSEADCKTIMSPEFENKDRSTRARYGAIGICKTDIDMVAQPVGCRASGFAKRGNLIEFYAACRIKDYVADRRMRVEINVQSRDHILFSDLDFMIFGRYVRCSRQYTCVEAR
jgi:hypothetical protein